MTPPAAEPAADGLPAWLRTLATAAGTIRGRDLSRFLPPDDGSARPSAVLITLADTERGPSVLLIERAAGMRKHPGQVAFPGGSVDADDASPVACALREAGEEVGLDPASVVVLAQLPEIFIPVSGFAVTPVLAWWREPHEVRPVVAAEVARVGLVPIAELVDPEHRFRVSHPSGWLGPGFEVDDFFVWGFTAGLLDRLLALGGWARPWDETVVRPLPDSVIRR